MKQDNVTARLLGYLRYLMNSDPVVRKAGLEGPEHLHVSSETRGREIVAFLRTDRAGALPPLRIPAHLLAKDLPSGYNGVRQCVYGWLEANKEAIRPRVQRKPTKGGELTVSGPASH